MTISFPELFHTSMFECCIFSSLYERTFVIIEISVVFSSLIIVTFTT